MSRAMKELRKSIVRCRIMALAVPLFLSSLFILAFWSVDFTVPRNIVRDVFDFDDDYDNVDFDKERHVAEVAKHDFMANDLEKSQEEKTWAEMDHKDNIHNEETLDKKKVVNKDTSDKKKVDIVNKSPSNDMELTVTKGATNKSEEPEAIPKAKSVNERMLAALEGKNFVPVLLPPKAPPMNASELAALKSEAHKLYAERLQLVQRACSNNNVRRTVRNSSFKPIWQRHLYRLLPFRIGYCSITKTASTTWLHHLARLMGVQKVYTGRLTVMGNAKLYAQQKMRENFSKAVIPEDDFSKIDEKELAKTLNFVVVRHPFQRLVSAFVNKFVDFPGINEMAPIKNYVIKHFRDPHERQSNIQSAADMRNPKLLFHEFVPYMLERISRQEEVNEHFAPQWQSCPFCHMNFDVIGNLETINKDNDFVMNGLKIRNILLPTLAFNRVKGDYTMKAESVPLADQLFATITKSQVRALADYYDIDFKMFGYDDVQHYIDIAKDDPK